ncbi:MAG: SRPBCC family protein [Planctomycetes bacterium]|nr:SRPBCC family protein [Planctomycetota bacterium]
MMTWIISIAGILVGLPVSIMLIGSFLPEKFGATVSTIIDRPAEAVWSALTDYVKYPMSARMCRGVEPLPNENGLPAWRENLGSSRVRVQTLESVTPSRLVREMKDEVVPMQVHCEYTVKPAAQGCEVTSSMHGTIRKGTWHVPIFKFMIHVFGGAKSGQKQFLNSLKGS